MTLILACEKNAQGSGKELPDNSRGNSLRTHKEPGLLSIPASQSRKLHKICVVEWSTYNSIGLIGGKITQG